ncbi:MAG: zf-TFIIB domain-containing protein [Bdellovibrionales bacterium]
MKCPRCQAKTKTLKNHDVEVEVCLEGCGGIFFDWMELKKMDESAEADTHFLSQLSAGGFKKANLETRMDCPKCQGITMMRRFWSIKKSVELDECAKCGGIWLDAGELTHLHSLYKTEAERLKAAADYFDQLFGDDFSKLKAESDKAVASKISKVLKFVSPSHYLRKLSNYN